MMMRAEELADIIARVWRCPRTRADALAHHMLKALEFAEVSTPQRLAHWLGQTGHESGRGRYMAELWGPTVQQLRYEVPTTLARKLGNVRSGDGKRYMGRGLIQVTGRSNYRQLTARLRKIMGDEVPDFELAPLLLQSPEWASMSAADYWRAKGLNRFADADDLLTLTKRINGGTHGIADRQALTASAKLILGVAHA
jgi:putative chitinase